MEKLEWCGYPKVKKFWRYVYSFWQNARTWRTDGEDKQTPHNGIGRACTASRGKKLSKWTWPHQITWPWPDVCMLFWCLKSGVSGAIETNFSCNFSLRRQCMYVVVDFMPHAVYRQIADTAADLCLTLLCVISAGTLSNYCSHVHTLPIGSFSDGSSNRKISHLHTVTQCRTKKTTEKKLLIKSTVVWKQIKVSI